MYSDVNRTIVSVYNIAERADATVVDSFRYIFNETLQLSKYCVGDKLCVY